MSHRHFRPRRPPWWPPDEPFPPVSADARAWHRLRGRFMLRIGILFALFFVLAGVILTTLVSFIGSALGLFTFPHPAGAQPFFAVGLVFFFIILVVAINSFRRLAIPMGDLMNAAGRVAEGDYTARVPERGPGEVRALARAFNSMAARLQESDAQRRNLLADVTHELRTPLTVIQGNLEGLVDGVYPRDDAHLTPILDETRVLSRLIDDLRTLALAESGALKLQKEPVDLAVLVSETVASLRGQADAAGIELRAELAEDLPFLELDPARIREVLENLIANALRYTPRGGTIQVDARVEAEGKRVSIAVSDTGSGIPPQELEHVFDRFYKSRDSRGTGLGLAIARNLVAAHGGEISAQSQVGRGTIFRLTLPIR